MHGASPCRRQSQARQRPAVQVPSGSPKAYANAFGTGTSPKCRLPLRPCGIEQAKQFQAYLTEYQINIVSKEYENKIIYADPEKDKKIYLYMHNNHYDVITKMPGFFARNYYCHACKKVYDHLENHVCPNECKCCGFSPICPEESWRSCRNCRRQFKSQRCYDQHKQSKGGARPICARLIKCTKCGQHVPRYSTLTLFVNVLNKHAPIQSKRIRKRGNIPWLNSEVKTKLFKRDSLKKKAIQTNNEHDWKLYRLSRNDANSALRSAKKDYYVNKFSNNHRNPKASWKTINDILGRSKKQDVIKEIKLPEKTVTSTEELVDVFNEHFINIGPNLAETIQNENDGSFQDYINKQDPEFTFQPVSIVKVYNLINNLWTSKATGIDKISAKVLRAAASAIAPSLTEIFNMSIDSNRFPSDWKTARVIPLFKNGQRSVLDNYRPISILPVVSKIMERLLYNQISDYFTKKQLLSKHQFGFRPLHSTTTTLLDCTNEWYVNMDRGLYNLVVLLDLKKAFDTVNHGILLHKLQLYGFETRALNFMRDYLTNRTQRCQLKGLFSDRKEVTCGIPQGSILGPLLFIIYINDLPNCLKITTPRMFADDTNLTAVGETLGEAEERAGVDLRNVQKWLSLNKLSLNIAKTEYILIASRHKITRIDVQPTVKINSQHIKRVKCTKVLGVQIDEHLSWNQHIEYIANKISSGIGAIRKLRTFIDTSTLVLVYNALIQPYFDYCCEVWDTLGKGLSERLQKLHNRAARLIMNLKNEHGHSVLARNSLGWELLEKRRVEMKARIMYKTVNKLAPSRLCDLFQNVNKINDYNLRGSSTRVYIPMPKTEFLKQSFCYDGAKIWNQLPDEIRNSASLTSFCRKLSSSTFDLS